MISKSHLGFVLGCIIILATGALCFSAEAQEAVSRTAQGGKASPGRSPSRGRDVPKRVFSAEPSVEPQTAKAIELSKAIGDWLGKGVTKQSLAKHRLKKVTKGFANTASEFSISDSKADGRAPARGKVRLAGGDLFVAFIPTEQGGIVGVIEAWKRPVGKKPTDIEREVQLNALGFKVHALVDSYQLVLWESLDSHGLGATIASKPAVLTAPLSPALTASLLSRREVHTPAKAAKTVGPPPAILLAAASLVVADLPKGPIGETQPDPPPVKEPGNNPPQPPKHGVPRDDDDDDPPNLEDPGCPQGGCEEARGDKGDRTDPSGPPGGGSGGEPDRIDPSGPFVDPDDEDRVDPSGPPSSNPDATVPMPGPYPSVIPGTSGTSGS